MTDKATREVGKSKLLAHPYGVGKARFVELAGEFANPGLSECVFRHGCADPHRCAHAGRCTYDGEQK